MKSKSGIYRIRCIVTGEFYIGSSANIAARFKEHKYDLRHSIHHNYKLLAEWERHGEESFVFEIVEECEGTAALMEREQHWIDTSNPPLNISRDTRRPALGLKRRQDWKDKQARAMTLSHAKMTPAQKEQRRKAVSAGWQEWWESLTDGEREEARQRRSHTPNEGVRAVLREKSTGNKNAKGHIKSDEALEKIRISTQARWDETKSERDTAKEQARAEFEVGMPEREQERRQKISEARTGKVLSDSTKEKLRQVALAQQADPEYQRKHAAGLAAVMGTPEMRQKLSAAHKGKTFTAEHKAAIGAAQVGKKRSEETKRKQSEARKAYWAKRKAQANE